MKIVAVGRVDAGGPVEYTGLAAELDADLLALRSGTMQPLVRLSDEQLEALDNEPVGEDFSTRPFEW